MLTKCEKLLPMDNATVGPECRKCGCNATFLVEAGGGSRPWAKFRCDFCGDMATVRGDGTPATRGVSFQRIRCPECDSTDTHVASSGPAKPANRIRYHKCNACEHTFKSVER